MPWGAKLKSMSICLNNYPWRTGKQTHYLVETQRNSVPFMGKSSYNLLPLLSGLTVP